MHGFMNFVSIGMNVLFEYCFLMKKRLPEKEEEAGRAQKL
jgi:hypothetical protein